MIKINEKEAIMALLVLVNILLVGPGSWVVKGALGRVDELHDEVDKLREELSELALHIAENYERKR